MGTRQGAEKENLGNSATSFLWLDAAALTKAITP